jgi:hypothetical protein
MLKTLTDHELWNNQLLDALAPASRKRIDPHLEAVEFKLGEMVSDAGGLLKHAYSVSAARSAGIRGLSCRTAFNSELWTSIFPL